MKFVNSLYSASALVLCLSSCGTVDGVDDNGAFLTPAPLANSTGTSVADYPVKIGEPYKVGSKTYVPKDVSSYDEVGYASWYGQEQVGNATANGEVFNPNGISAAHKTLPLPTYVEVTALDTGRTILVRINDRGPFSDDREIDLSQGAAQQLGLNGQGVSGVRVRKVNPNEQERAVLRNGSPVTERIATPDSLLKILRTNLAKLPKPKISGNEVVIPRSKPSETGASYARSGPSRTTNSGRDGRFIIEENGAVKPVVSNDSVGNNYVSAIPGSTFVQVAAFSSKQRAEALAKKIGAKTMQDETGKIWRVRYGPYANDNQAKAGVAQAEKYGYKNSKIFRAE